MGCLWRLPWKGVHHPGASKIYLLLEGEIFGCFHRKQALLVHVCTLSRETRGSRETRQIRKSSISTIKAAVRLDVIMDVIICFRTVSNSRDSLRGLVDLFEHILFQGVKHVHG